MRSPVHINLPNPAVQPHHISKSEDEQDDENRGQLPILVHQVSEGCGGKQCLIRINDQA
jgi:hypothetical protein